MTDVLGPFLYVLDHLGVPHPETDRARWAEAFERDRTAARVTVDGVVISTVFLGLDHAWGRGPPLLFETAVFAEGAAADIVARYATRTEALRGHKATVDRIVAIVTRATHD